MKNLPNKMRSTSTAARRLSLVCVAISFFALATNAQTTSFTFQNTLPLEITPATGTFEMEFRLFDAATNGTQIGATVTIAEVAVKTRAFAVQLDFGAAAFPGANRFVEIRVRHMSEEPFTIIATRPQILSAPYAIRALSAATADNALNLGGVDASDFVQTTDTRLSDSRDPNPGSNNYIQNTTSTQTPANFNISGDGTAGGTLSGSIVNAATRFDIGGLQVLSVAGGANLFVGREAGFSNTTGFNNLFVGTEAGLSNTTGSRNSFVGRGAGLSNTTGGFNSFVGTFAGFNNTTGGDNSFVGTEAGVTNTTGSDNSFVGRSAGFRNTTGSFNSFFGRSAGRGNTTGSDNSFVGTFAGLRNTTGGDNSFFGRDAGDNNTTGSNNTIIGRGADVGSGDLSFATAIGSGAVVDQSNTIALGRSNGDDKVRVFGLGAAGSTQLCRNANNEISTCSSSLRYKTNIAPFSFGLSLIKQLRPVSYKWKDGGMKDVGFGAEDVARVNPLFVNYNTKGEVEGVKYDRLSAVFVNAFKEQQAQIETQQKQINEQQALIENLRLLVCRHNAQAAVCQEK